MSGIGAVSVVASVDVAAKELMFTSGRPWACQTINMSIGGCPSIGANLVMTAYVNGTLVMAADDFTGGPGTVTGAIESNTTPLNKFMKLLPKGRWLDVDVRLWDSDSQELLATGTLRIYSNGFEYTADTGDAVVPAVSGSTLIWGIIAKVGGVTYLYNNTDSRWYPLNGLAGTGDAMHLDWDPDNGLDSIPEG